MFMKIILILIMLLLTGMTPRIAFSDDEQYELIETYKKDVEVHPDDIAVRLELGLAYEKVGNIEEAIKHYTIILETASQTSSTHDRQTLALAKNQLAWLYAEQEIHLDQALQFATEAAAMRPAAGILDTLGWVHYKRGEYRLARRQFQQALKQTPNQPSIRYHLALTQAKLGNKQAAIQELQQAFATSSDFKEADDAQQLLTTLEDAINTAMDDNSFSTEEYAALGIPHTIETIVDYAQIYAIFSKLAEQKKNVLPKYDSPQSQEIFHLLFSPTTIDRIFSQITTYQEQQQILLTYYQTLDYLSSLYHQQNSSYMYSDEIERIGLLRLYALLRFYELFEENLQEDAILLNDMFPSESERFMFSTNLSDQYCTRMILSSKAQNLDRQTQEYISATLLTYSERIKAISFIDAPINFTTEFCWDLYEKRQEILSTWPEQ